MQRVAVCCCQNASVFVDFKKSVAMNLQKSIKFWFIWVREVDASSSDALLRRIPVECTLQDVTFLHNTHAVREVGRVALQISASGNG